MGHLPLFSVNVLNYREKIFFMERDRRINPFLVGKWLSFSISRQVVLYPIEKQNSAELHAEALESG